VGSTGVGEPVVAQEESRTADSAIDSKQSFTAVFLIDEKYDKT
jgi:hypothetical protein